MKWGIFDRIQKFLSRFKYTHDYKPTKLGLGGWLCFTAKVAGVVMFFGSCLAVLLPFLIGATWLEAILIMGTGMMISRQFLYFDELYLEAMAMFMYIWTKLVRGES